MSPVDAGGPGDGTHRPVLREGETCWRIAHADRIAVIVDAAAYFAAAKAAILQARHTVFLIGWDFDLRIRLERTDPMPGVPDELGEFLTHVVKNRPDLRIFVLRWDLSFLKFPFRATLPLKLLDWLAGKRLELRLDHEHPTGACHHQKIVVVDDSVAFCGGIDMTDFRWDTPAHTDDNPCRVDPGRAHYPPWHDTTTCIMGEAARVLGSLARERWHRATGEEVPPSPPCDPCWPDHLSPDFTDLQVAIARTEPAYGEAQPEVREIEALYLAAIRAARRTIYIETQYFASHRIAMALGKRLQEENGPEVVIVNPKSAVGWLEEEVMGPARAVLLKHIGECDRHGRFRIYTPVTEKGQDIYVHSKVVVVDDWLLRVGSSNLNNRSMGLDTECDLAVEVPPATDSSETTRRTITSVRNRLAAEHLGVPQEQFAETVEAENGSLIGAIERLRREHGRSLAPFEAPPFSDLELAVAESRALDPDRPEDMSEALRRGLAGPGLGKALGIGLAAATGMAAAVVLGRRQTGAG
ncbi:phospholipase D-like domain-containing protein [Microvirga splendida]|uniref:Phospholipase D n=1 Tax=Microvirga splendida TaxID=2795727 RepID=A0ABS0Y3H7_9HYPH|nr:phospholipase D-like domain-containing protein [Microvirga splendida]MBJ6126814.1 phospholipase [Microvirga splendida]